MSKITDALERLGALPEHLHIDGRKIHPGDRDLIESTDPGSDTPIASVPAGRATDIEAAVAAARRALVGPWSAINPRERGQLLWRIGEAIRADSERLSLVETLDTGKPLGDARNTVARTADYFCYYAGMVDKLHGETIPLGPA